MGSKKDFFFDLKKNYFKNYKKPKKTEFIIKKMPLGKKNEKVEKISQVPDVEGRSLDENMGNDPDWKNPFCLKNEEKKEKEKKEEKEKKKKKKEEKEEQKEKEKKEEKEKKKKKKEEKKKETFSCPIPDCTSTYKFNESALAVHISEVHESRKGLIAKYNKFGRTTEKIGEKLKVLKELDETIEEIGNDIKDNDVPAYKRYKEGKKKIKEYIKEYLE